MEGRRALLLPLLVGLLASPGCLAAGRDQQPLDVGVDGDQVAEGSSWMPYVWNIAGEGHHYEALLPLARPRQRRISDEPELLYSVYESRPLLAKEGLTDEEAAWVPDAAPLRTIKEHYASGSLEFDHHFGLSPRTTVTYTSPYTTPPPPQTHTEASPPHTPAPTPKVDASTSYAEAPTPNTQTPTTNTQTPTPNTQTPTPYSSASKPHTLPLALPLLPHIQPPKYVLPLRRRPRKYYLADNTGDDKHKTPPHHDPFGFRKYYIDPASKGISEELSHPPSSIAGPQHFPLIYAQPPPSYPSPLHPHPPPTVRQYFLQPPVDQEPHVSNVTPFEVYEKLRKTRMVDIKKQDWPSPEAPKSTAWVSFTSSFSRPGTP